MTLFDALGIVLTVTCVALLRMTDIIWMQSGGVAAAETATVGIACGATLVWLVHSGRVK